jgi:hypothetical protein
MPSFTFLKPSLGLQLMTRNSFTQVILQSPAWSLTVFTCCFEGFKDELTAFEQAKRAVHRIKAAEHNKSSLTSPLKLIFRCY